MILLFACRLFYRVNSNSSFCSNYGVTGYGVNSNNFFNCNYSVNSSRVSVFGCLAVTAREERNAHYNSK